MTTMNSYSNPLHYFNNLSDPTVSGADLSSSEVAISDNAFDTSGLGSNAIASDAAAGSVGVNPATVDSNKSGFFGDDFWTKDGGAGMMLGGVKVLGNLWSAVQANKMAKRKMAFAREQWNTNLTNQTKTYNTALEDRIRGRYATGTRTEDQLSGEINKHRL